MRRKFITILIATLLLLGCIASVSAETFDPEKTCSIAVTLVDPVDHTPMVGAELRLYYIATVDITEDDQLFYACTATFAKADIALDDPDLIAKLEAYITSHTVPVEKQRTDETGNATWKNLPLGLYLIRQVGTVEGFAPCDAFLVTVPMKTQDGFLYEVNASPKTEVAKLTSITVRKVWNTDASTKISDSVTVQLLRDGVVIETVTLSEENDWQVTFTDLPGSDAYTIREVDVPPGFTATYQQNAYTFTVTNTSTLIQTGQLIWPIPVLAFVGVLLIAAGCMLLQKKRTSDG